MAPAGIRAMITPGRRFLDVGVLDRGLLVDMLGSSPLLDLVPEISKISRDHGRLQCDHGRLEGSAARSPLDRDRPR